MAIEVADGANVLDIDASGSAAMRLLDASGNPLARPNRSAIDPAVQSGVIMAGVDHEVMRIVRVSPDGTLRTGEDLPIFFDSCEGAAVDTNKWIQTLTTMTITQAVSTGVLLNAGSSAATTVGAMHASQRRFAFMNRKSIAFRSRQRLTAHFNNNLYEAGLVNPPAAATTLIVPDGAFWRKEADGSWRPYIAINGTETGSGSAVSDATFRAAIGVNDYFSLEVFLEETRATFRIRTTGGAIVNEQILEFPTNTGTFAVTHLQAFYRLYNSGATGTAVQAFVSQLSVWDVDSINSPWEDIVAAMGTGGSLTNPLTTFGQLANYANSAAPASATLSNTAAGYTTLGGQWQFAAVAGAETDYALFAIQIPAPYAFRVRRVRINMLNTVVAVATTATVMQWGLGFNGSAVSLATGAPYPYMRKAIGVRSFPIGAAVGATVDPVEWEGNEVVMPGRFFAIILKMPVATATATEIFRGTAFVEGHFLN
jgi:hypothetical protein